MGDCQACTVVGDAQISGGFGNIVWDEVLLKLGLEPIGIEHERRTHDRTAAAVEPFALGFGLRIRFGGHLSDFPPEFDLAIVAMFQLSPRWLDPITPR